MKRTFIKTAFIHFGIFLSLSLVLTPTVFATAAPQYPNPLNPGGNGPVNTIPEFLAFVLDALWLLLTPLIIIFIIYAGYLFVIAQGEEAKIQKARHAILWALVGAGVILAARIMANILKDTVSQLN